MAAVRAILYFKKSTFKPRVRFRELVCVTVQNCVAIAQTVTQTVIFRFVKMAAVRHVVFLFLEIRNFILPMRLIGSQCVIVPNPWQYVEPKLSCGDLTVKIAAIRQHGFKTRAQQLLRWATVWPQ